jgi:uncharacterized protein YcbK (DUF882 family)
MLPIIAQLRAAATMMAMATPAPVPVVAMAEAAVEPVDVKLYDGNLQLSAEVAIMRDGSTDDATAKEIRHLFRDRAGRERKIAKRTLALLADVSEHFDKPVEFVSVFRGGDLYGSPHLDGRAIDFRIKGIKLTEVRDYIWAKYDEVGVGWYPYESFIHMDSRSGEHDCAWTFFDGVEHYHPYWAEVARQPKQEHKPGV